VRVLLTKGANYTLKDGYGKSALAHAVLQGHFSIAKMLINHGADINQNLLYAARRGYKNMVVFLLEESAEIDYLSPHNETPLNLASQGKHWETAKFFWRKVQIPHCKMPRDRLH